MIFFREFKRNWRGSFSLALGLVLLTTFVVGVIFKWLFPEFPWALAFAFGAIVSPPDAVAATTLLKRFAINPRLIAILEGESLVNDASALVLYKLSVVALLSGIFSLQDASLEFIKVVSVGTLVGFVLGMLLQNLSRLFFDPIVGVIFSFTIPYVTYISADALGGSGVLAVVVNGLIGSRILAKHHSSLRRVIGYASWDTFVILMNCFVFILIGLHLKRLVALMSVHEIVLYSAYGVLMTAVLIVVRLLWVFSKSCTTNLLAFLSPKKSTICSQILRESAIISWSGMRGIVSLVAALALPLTMPDGSPIQGREVVVFLTFIVILMTLLLPSSTLTYLISLLKMDYPVDHGRVHHARKRLAQIAEKKIHHLHETKSLTRENLAFLINTFRFSAISLKSPPRPIKKCLIWREQD